MIAQFSPIIVEDAYYFPFAVICLWGILFTFLFLPETKGMTEKQIQNDLNEKVKNYKACNM